MTQTQQTQPSNEAPKNKVVAVEYEADGQRVKLTPSIVKEYIAGNKDITMPEFKFFTELCKARKLNPFLKEAYLIKYGTSPAQIVVSKDVILKRAVLHPKYNGKESGVIVKDSNGKITERTGCFYDAENEVLLGGWCRVYRKDWDHPEYMSVSLNEVGQRKENGKLNVNWALKTATMLEKVAKVRALREAFVEEFAGMYVEDEIQEQETEEPVRQSDPLDDPIEEAIEVKAKAVSQEAEDEDFDFSSL